mgnify:CR=1 FL=1
MGTDNEDCIGAKTLEEIFENARLEILKKEPKEELIKEIIRQDDEIYKLRKDKEKDKNNLLVFSLIIWLQMILILIM